MPGVCFFLQLEYDDNKLRRPGRIVTRLGIINFTQSFASERSIMAPHTLDEENLLEN